MVLVIMDLSWDTLVEAVEFPIRIRPKSEPTTAPVMYLMSCRNDF
jgi:hypothetical protein